MDELQYYKKLVRFQTDLMDHLYDTREEIYKIVCRFFGCRYLILCVCDEKGMVSSSFYQVQEETSDTDYLRLDATVGRVFQMNEQIGVDWAAMPQELSQFLEEYDVVPTECVTSFGGKSENTLYAAILCHDRDKGVLQEINHRLIDYVRIYLENRIFHECVTFESQHDMLTKLYNRRYYFKCCREIYPMLASVGLFYFDVNNLKETNDVYGHDAGDALLQKAAESIRHLTSENVQGFRMGGDEFILVAMNCTKAEMVSLQKEWEHELESINEKYGGDPCVIAVGTAYAKGNFEIEELCRIADKRMYRDKRKKKRAAR